MMKRTFLFLLTGMLNGFTGSAFALTIAGITSDPLILDEHTHSAINLELKPAFLARLIQNSLRVLILSINRYWLRATWHPLI